MSLLLKTLLIDGEGTEAKMLVTDTHEDFETLKVLVAVGVSNWPNTTMPPSVVGLAAVVLGEEFANALKRKEAAKQGEM